MSFFICLSICPTFFILDTDRLFTKSYDLLDKTVRKYQITIKVYYPRHETLQAFVENEGINGIYDSIDNRKQCCYLRKIEPLKKKVLIIIPTYYFIFPLLVRKNPKR